MKKFILFMFLFITSSNGYSYEISFLNNTNKYFAIKYPYEILQNVFNNKLVNPHTHLKYGMKITDYHKENNLFSAVDNTNQNNWLSSIKGASYTYHKINMKQPSSFIMSDRYIRSITSSIGFAFTGKVKYSVNNSVSLNFSTDFLMRMLQIMGGTFDSNDSIRVNAYVSYRF